MKWATGYTAEQVHVAADPGRVRVVRAPQVCGLCWSVYSELYGTRAQSHRMGDPAALPATAHRITLSYMKTSALTIRLDPDLDEQLDRLARESGRSRSDLARDALRRQLAVLQFEQARRQIMPFAEARGYLTDEDVFDAVS